MTSRLPNRRVLIVGGMLMLCVIASLLVSQGRQGAVGGRIEPAEMANPATMPVPASIPSDLTETADPAPGTLAATSLPALQVQSLDGQPRDLKSFAGRQATLLVFLSTECPISNGYIPTLNRMADDFGSQGLSVVGINPHDHQSLEALNEHHDEFQLRFPIVQDSGAQVAAGLQANVTPEAFLFDPSGRLVYRGRIDDRYHRRGGAAGALHAHDLQRALHAVLAGKPVDTPVTVAIGCPIVLPASKVIRSPQTAEVTYSREVAPILQQHCQSCHRPGGIGPFSLENYQDALNWAGDIKRFTAERTMPPWKPTDGYGEFHNRRALSEAQIKLLGAWVDAGSPQGDLADLPEPPEFDDNWTLGTPDLVLEPNEDYQLAADGEDVYRCFVLPTDFERDQYVVSMQVKPGNAAVVHHVIAFLDGGNRSAELDTADPGPGYSTSQGFPGFLPSGGLGGWAPGNSPRKLPEGMALVMPAGSKVVMQVHYHKTGKPETDRTQLGLYFSEVPVTRAVGAIPVTTPGGPLGNFKIPAGAKNHEVRGSVVVPRDVLALSVTPHMHLLGRDMQVTATLPDGNIQPLVWVQDWDFNWQETYQYREPVLLPAGTRLDLVAHYDNSESNPHNPRRPPETVRWGEQTHDEMCIAFLQVAPLEEAASQDELKPPPRGQMLVETLRGGIQARLERLRQLPQRWLGRSASAAASQESSEGK